MIQTIDTYKDIIDKAYHIFRTSFRYYAVPKKEGWEYNEEEYLSVQQKNIFGCNYYDYVLSYTADNTKIKLIYTKNLPHSVLCEIPVECFEMSNEQLKELKKENYEKVSKIVDKRIQEKFDENKRYFEEINKNMGKINALYKRKNLKKQYKDRVLELLGNEIILREPNGDYLPIMKFKKLPNYFYRNQAEKFYPVRETKISPKLKNYIYIIIDKIDKSIQKYI